MERLEKVKQVVVQRRLMRLNDTYPVPCRERERERERELTGRLMWLGEGRLFRQIIDTSGLASKAASGSHVGKRCGGTVSQLDRSKFEHVSVRSSLLCEWNT